MPNPSKAGYSFKGWSNVQNPDIANISTFFTKVKVDNSMTVYPCFVDDIAPVLTVNAATEELALVERSRLQMELNRVVALQDIISDRQNRTLQEAM